MKLHVLLQYLFFLPYFGDFCKIPVTEKLQGFSYILVVFFQRQCLPDRFPVQNTNITPTQTAQKLAIYFSVCQSTFRKSFCILTAALRYNANVHELHIQ